MMFLLKILFNPLFFTGIFAVGNMVLLLTTDYYRKKYHQTKTELESVKKELETVNIKYKECVDGMEKVKVDYEKKLKDFIKNYKFRTHYDKLKEVPPERGDRDECEQIKELLDIYREVEQSGYFNNRSNRIMLTSGDQN